jgi:hypothetical protein
MIHQRSVVSLIGTDQEGPDIHQPSSAPATTAANKIAVTHPTGKRTHEL